MLDDMAAWHKLNERSMLDHICSVFDIIIHGSLVRVEGLLLPTQQKSWHIQQLQEMRIYAGAYHPSDRPGPPLLGVLHSECCILPFASTQCLFSYFLSQQAVGEVCRQLQDVELMVHVILPDSQEILKTTKLRHPSTAPSRGYRDGSLKFWVFIYHSYSTGD